MQGDHQGSDQAVAARPVLASRRDQDRVPTRAVLLLALIVLLTALLRLPDLQSAPVGGQGDISWVGLNALDWIDRGVWPFYVRELYSPEFPVVYLNGLLIPFTGISYLAPRLITAVTGLLFVAMLFPATWWLTREKSRVFRERASLLAALAGAMSIQAMYLSRIGMESPPFLAGVTLVVWLTAWAWYHPRPIRWILAGAALGLAQYIYLPARVLPVVIFVWIAYSWLTDRQWFRVQWRGWLTMALVAAVLTLPAIILFVTVPGSFSGRADTGTAITGGWAWNYDTSTVGGLPALMVKKIALTLLALGITFNGPYTIMGQPMLTPLFFIGLLVAVGALFRAPRDIAVVWPLLAIPVMLITDLISGAIVEVHALHEMGILPFVFILSGVGLAFAWDRFDRLKITAIQRRLVFAILLVVAIAPSLVETYRYLRQVIPAQYADPQTGWSAEQIDLDLSQKIITQPDRAYLLPYHEYSRSNVAWLISQTFRERLSAINTAGVLQIPNPPFDLTVITTDMPERPRHDARLSEVDTRLWVLLKDGQTWLLPPLTPAQEQSILSATKAQSGAQIEPLIDRSNTEIAKFTTIPTPAGLFTPRAVIDHPLDATFNGQIKLKGYTIRDENLTPGKVLFVTLYWQAETPPSEDYEIFVQVWNDAKQSLAGTHDFPYGGAYRTRIWRTGEIVATQHWLMLPDQLPTGRYTLAIGMTHLIGEIRLPVNGPSADSSLQVVLAPDLRNPQPQAVPGTPPLQPIQFGDVFSVAGLDATLDGQAQTVGQTWQVKPTQTLAFNVTWKALVRPPEDYSVFVHISPSASALPLAQVDSTMGGEYPSGAWWKGDLVQDHLTMKLPADLAPGSYQVLMGVYFWQTGQRLPLMLDGKTQPDAQYLVGTIVSGK